MRNQWERVFKLVAAMPRLAREHGLDDPAELQYAISVGAARLAPPGLLPELLDKVERAAPETSWTEDVGMVVIAPQARDTTVPAGVLASSQSPVRTTAEQRAAIGDRLASVLGSLPAGGVVGGQSVEITPGWPLGGDELGAGYLLPTVVAPRGVYVFWAADGTAVIPLCQFRMGRRHGLQTRGARAEQEELIGVIGGDHGFIGQLSWACDQVGLTTRPVLEGLLEETAVLAARNHRELRPGLHWERSGLVYEIRPTDRPMSTLVHVTLASEQASDGTASDEGAVEPTPLLIVQLMWDRRVHAWMLDQVWPREQEADLSTGDHGAGHAHGAARRFVAGTARVAAVPVALTDLLLVLFQQREHLTTPNLSLVLAAVVVLFVTVGAWPRRSRRRNDHDANGTHGS